MIVSRQLRKNKSVNERKKKTCQIYIEKKAEQCGNIRATARKYKIYPQQIRQWKRDQDKFIAAIKQNPKVKTVHSGKPIESTNVEQDVLSWIR